MAVINTTVERKGTRDIAEEYLNYMYTDEVQRLVMEISIVPAAKKFVKEKKDVFKDLRTLPNRNVFGTWKDVQEKTFLQRGLFEEMMK